MPPVDRPLADTLPSSEPGPLSSKDPRVEPVERPPLRSYTPLPRNFSSLKSLTSPEEQAVAIAAFTPEERSAAVVEALLAYAGISTRCNQALPEIREELHAIRAELLVHLGRFVAIETKARVVAVEARNLARVARELVLHAPEAAQARGDLLARVSELEKRGRDVDEAAMEATPSARGQMRRELPSYHAIVERAESAGEQIVQNFQRQARDTSTPPPNLKQLIAEGVTDELVRLKEIERLKALEVLAATEQAARDALKRAADLAERLRIEHAAERKTARSRLKWLAVGTGLTTAGAIVVALAEHFIR